MTKPKTNEAINSSISLEDSNQLDSKKEHSIDLIDEDTGSSKEISEKNNHKGFSAFGFSKGLIKTLEKKGYEEPTPIQKAAIPELLLGRDLLGQAQTGTGKTAAFALPLLERINNQERNPQVLVLTPTRELAIQIHKDAQTLNRYCDLEIGLVYGGVDYEKQQKKLSIVQMH